MSDIETVSRDVVLPLVQGNPAKLDRDQQRRLATWCFMKLITLELGRPEDELATYPAAVYRGFCVYQHPPNGCLISIGFREVAEDPPIFVWWRSQAGEENTTEVGPVASYRTTLTVGHLVTDVIGLIHSQVSVTTESDERFAQVWPVRSETLDWPPRRSFKGIVNNDLE